MKLKKLILPKSPSPSEMKWFASYAVSFRPEFVFFLLFNFILSTIFLSFTFSDFREHRVCSGGYARFFFQHVSRVGNFLASAQPPPPPPHPPFRNKMENGPSLIQLIAMERLPRLYGHVMGVVCPRRSRTSDMFLFNCTCLLSSVVFLFICLLILFIYLFVFIYEFVILSIFFLIIVIPRIPVPVPAFLVFQLTFDIAFNLASRTARDGIRLKYLHL